MDVAFTAAARRCCFLQYLLQAATAASMAEHPSHSTPQEGDGFTFEQYADRSVSAKFDMD
jgi:hypothetical protein